MKRIQLLKSIFIAPDIILAALIGLFVYIFSPELISNAFCKDIFGIAISILSIIFSVYFAALVFVMSASDNDFIRFLEEKKRYTYIIGTFRISLVILFSALMISIIAYVATLAMIEMEYKYQQKWIIAIFTFSFLYGLFAALATTLDSIRFALSRVSFLKRITDIAKEINNEKR